ncbi:unnamed protein product [Lactuca saligna]|uniref:Uncharacterized protein n=1 Tax=Lactuca saligna TaxID=75948 RepID=A0AA35ZBD4_LACSI|nr:unnamed protein product [Lactuca saligna]
MSSVCISNSVDDARIPIRATYKNLYRWPESDAEFMKKTMAGSNQHRRDGPGVVDSISCRQLYLRSYTFSKKETAGRTKKCLDRVRQKVVAHQRNKRKGAEVGRGRRRCMVVMRRVKAVSRNAVSAVFKRLLLFCTVDSRIR